MEDKQAKKLTKKQEVFISGYLLCLNATEAARRAGYTDNDSLHKNAYKLRHNTTISEEINERLKLRQLSDEEALALQGDIARGDIGALADDNGYFDFKKAKAAGLTRLVKKFKQEVTTVLAKSEDGEDREIVKTEIELYPADVAQERILKVAGRFVNKVDVTSKGEKIGDDAEFRAAILGKLASIAESKKAG